MSHLAILFTNFGPYHIARAKALHQYCVTQGWDCSAIELARSEQEYPWEIDVDQLAFTLHSITRDRLESCSFHQLIGQLYRLLNRLNPDVVAIAGYARPSMLAALLWCQLNHKAAVLFSETHEQDTARVPWKELPKKGLLRLFRAALVGGTPQRQYLTKLGMNSQSIFTGYNIVDNQTFDPQKLSTLAPPLSRPYFLTINRFIPKKNLLRILEAYADYYQQMGTATWDLVLAGDGPLRPDIEARIQTLGLSKVVHLPGFLQEHQLLPYFAHAKCFIHASTHEQWGLVVNEAMAAGLPVLVSNRCGCFDDLVLEGKTGFGFDPMDTTALSSLMVKINSETHHGTLMGQNAFNHIQQFSPEYFAQNLVKAAQFSLNSFAVASK